MPDLEGAEIEGRPPSPKPILRGGIIRFFPPSQLDNPIGDTVIDIEGCVDIHGRLSLLLVIGLSETITESMDRNDDSHERAVPCQLESLELISCGRHDVALNLLLDYDIASIGEIESSIYQRFD